MKLDYQYLITVLIIAGVAPVLLIVRKMLFSFFRRLALKTTSQVDDL